MYVAYCFTEIASEGLKGRVFEVSLADLQNDEVAFRKFKLVAEEVQGRNVLTNFHSMDLTTDKLRLMVKKWQTLIEAHVDVKTTDGFLLRLFAIGFTKKQQNQIKKTCYAQSTQVNNSRNSFRCLYKHLPAFDGNIVVHAGACHQKEDDGNYHP